MKEPATRVVQVTRRDYATRDARTTNYATKIPQRKPHRIRSLIVLLVLAVGVWGAVQQASGPGGVKIANTLRTVLGLNTAVPLTPTAVGQTSAPLLGVGTAGAPTPVATHSVGSRAAIPVTPSPVGSVSIPPTPLPGAIAPGTIASTATVVATRVATRVAALRIVTPVLVPAVVLQKPPASKLLQNDYQVFETWNNCGPASLSMALSYFGVQESQAALGADLRPYQNSQGDNDDKDVTFSELAREVKKFGLLSYYRPDGNIAILKQFISLGVPVIAETVMTKDDDIGHYRVVKGYNDATGMITQGDSMQGHNVQYSYADFDYMWKKYNYEYLVIVPRDKQKQAEAILGKNIVAEHAWKETVAMDRAMLLKNPTDIDSRFNLSVALYYTGAYQQSVAQFEQVQNQLPARTLWYQIEPLEAYYALGEYQKVFSLSDAILNSGDRAFSQLYILRGKIDQRQGNVQAAKAEYANAVLYNTNLQAAQDALHSVER